MGRKGSKGIDRYVRIFLMNDLVDSDGVDQPRKTDILSRSFLK